MFYWIKNSWEIVLKEPKADHIKIHPLAMLLMAPLMGGLFVVFLPFLGFYMLGKVIITKLYNAIASVIVAKIPLGEAYFTERKKK